MSCPKTRGNIDKKPSDTAKKTHVWSAIKSNPNLYCWIPVSKKNTPVESVDFDTVNVQDIPSPPGYKEAVEGISAMAEGMAHKILLKKLKEGTDIVSADDPRKYHIVKDFIIKKGLKVYGGAAINMYLPHKNKIYGPYTVPDYDVYSPTPWKDAVELADLLHSKGFKYVNVRGGIHKGTYKVSVNFWEVADISYMPPDMYNRMETRKFKGFRVVSSVILLKNMYEELSLPYGEVKRWSKVSARQKLLMKWANPIRKNLKCSKDIFMDGKVELEPYFLTLLENVAHFLHDKKLLLTGPQAYNMYMAVGGARRRVAIKHYEALSENAHTDVQELLSQLLPLVDDPKNLVITSYYDASLSYNNMRYGLYVKLGDNLTLLCYLYQLTECTPYRKIAGNYIVSIDYMYLLLYGAMSLGEDPKRIKDAKCMAKYLHKVQTRFYREKDITEFDDSLFQRFIVKCRGPIKNTVKHIFMARREERAAEQLKKSLKLSNIPEECKNVPKEDCAYPCEWVDERNRCMGVKGTYQL